MSQELTKRGLPSGQRGFSLVEIAIVLVVIGLLIGSILKGQEMISSARVRSLADMTTSIQASYFGFIDRFHVVPGDWDGPSAENAIGVPMNSAGGNNNGRLDHPNGTEYAEPVALWEQLSKSGFLQGAYVGGAPADEPDVNSSQSPLNAFNSVVAIGRTRDYEGTNPVRLQVVVGRGVPAKVMRELDLKLDDGVPDTGIFRATRVDGSVEVFDGLNSWGGREASCIASGPPMIWDVSQDAQDCNGVLLF